MDYPRIEECGFTIKSDKTQDYNCISWAMGDPTRWWDPSGAVPHAVWPEGFSTDCSVNCIEAVLKAVGYDRCTSGDAEEGYDKAALIGIGEDAFEHVSWWSDSQKAWSSKLGEWEDGDHETLDGALGRKPSRVLAFMKRPSAHRDDRAKLEAVIADLLKPQEQSGASQTSP